MTDIAIAVSKSTADFVIKARQMPPEQVKVVYLGVPLEEFSRTRSRRDTAARAELGIAAGDVAIGSVTRLHDSKGNSYLVDAARLVLNERPKARFFVVGEGPLRERSSSRRAGWVSAIDSSSRDSRTTSRASSRRSMSACSRRSGKARR